MPIDPKKLQAFAGGEQPQAEEPEAEQPEGGEEDMQEGGEGRFGALIPLLEQYAEEIEAACDELPPEALEDPEMELEEADQTILVEGVNVLPEDLKAELKSAFGGGIEPEEAQELADHLESEDMIADPMRTAGWFQRVAAIADQIGGEDEETEEPQEEVSEEEMDEELEDAAFEEMDG